MAPVKGVWRPGEPSEDRKEPGSGSWGEIADAKEGHRLFNRGRFGQPLSGGGLRLHPLEALYLEEAGRVELRGQRTPVTSSDLAAYSDLRERGLVAKPEVGTDGSYLRVWSRDTGPNSAPRHHLHPVEEREAFQLDRALDQAEEALGRGISAMAGVVDEEGGLTHFELSIPQLGEGQVEHEPAASATPTTSATSSHSSNGSQPIRALLQDELLSVEEEEAKEALEPGGYGREIGKRYKLSLLEGLYLAQEGHVQIGTEQGEMEAPALAWQILKRQPDLPLRLAVYRLLRANRYLPKTGFKFGTHFRVYDKPMGQGHAPWLVQAFPAGHESSWPELARMVRLTHGVRKKLWLARVTEAAAEAALRGEELDPGEGGVRLLEVGWVRP